VSRPNALAVKARTLWRLGPLNVLRVGTYRVLLRSGFYRRILPIEAPISGPFFDWAPVPIGASAPALADGLAWTALADRVLAGELPAFSHRWVGAGFPPRWHRSLLTQVDAEAPQEHWTRLPDFGLVGGDVKGYWEAARFDGLLILTLGWLCSRRDDLRQAIEQWLEDWCLNNPGNAGLQWKCGQETAIRAMQLLLASELLQRWSGATTRPAMASLLAQHARRISPTLLYAIGQDNNHGTSEAAALFTIGTFLARRGEPLLAHRGRRWRVQGRHWLEDRLARLVQPDGSFSQHSTNYHRVLLDTCSFAETYRHWTSEPAFSARWMARCRAATHWLAGMTDPQSGDAPNLGANDGARLFVLHHQPFRDFRPSVQWAARLFTEGPAYAAGPQDEALQWLGLERANGAPPKPATCALWPDGGYAKLVVPRAWTLLRLPRYPFRPSHADGLHLDLWLDGQPLACDGGSFGYAAEERWQRYFTGTASHNTVQFDNRDQVPRVSRFLFGEWLDCAELSFDAAASTVSAAYRDHLGARHRRTVTLTPRCCRVVDEVAGFRERAVLRWRLQPGPRNWVATDRTCSNGIVRIEVGSATPIARLECVEGWQSRHYADMTALTVLEVEVSSSATLTTDITWPE
jgi:hypothetical protein